MLLIYFLPLGDTMCRAFMMVQIQEIALVPGMGKQEVPVEICQDVALIQLGERAVCRGARLFFGLRCP